MRISTLRMLGLGAAWLVAACARTDGGTVILPWKANEVWRVGGEDSRAISLAELYPFQVDADPHRVVVLDRSTQQVFLIDTAGRVADTLGRAGSGPGEFSAPWAVARDDSGGIAVVDLGARRLVSWSRDLALGDPVPIHEQLDSPRVRFLAGAPTFLAAGRGAGGAVEFQLVRVVAGSRVVLATVPKPPRRVADLPSCQAGQISLTPLFAPTIHWDTRGSLLVVAAGVEYAVDVYDGPRRIGTVRRPLPAARATEADALRAADNWRFNDCVVPPAEVIQAATYLETIPIIENVALAPDSIIWVQRRVANKARVIDLFDLSGRFLGTLESAIPFRAAFIDADRFIAVEPDSLDVPSVVAYRIDRMP